MFHTRKILQYPLLLWYPKRKLLFSLVDKEWRQYFLRRNASASTASTSSTKNVSQIAQETGYCRQTVSNVIKDTLPPQQCYTTHTIFQILRNGDYQKCISYISQLRARWRRTHALMYSSGERSPLGALGEQARSINRPVELLESMLP